MFSKVHGQFDFHLQREFIYFPKIIIYCVLSPRNFIFSTDFKSVYNIQISRTYIMGIHGWLYNLRNSRDIWTVYDTNHIRPVDKVFEIL